MHTDLLAPPAEDRRRQCPCGAVTDQPHTCAASAGPGSRGGGRPRGPAAAWRAAWSHGRPRPAPATFAMAIRTARKGAEN